jgi:hypothetical protein
MTDTPKASLAAAVAEGFTLPEGTVEETEAPVVVDKTPGTDGAQADVESKVVTGSESETEVVATTEGTDDLPDSYFEVDLSGLPAEEKAAIHAALKARDDEIGKLLRGAKEVPDPAAVAEVETPPEPMTDEAILTQLGLDPENPFDETATKVALPLVRALQGLSEQVQGLVEERELEQLDRYWTSSLDKLEADNGALPIDRTAVLEYAAANGLQSPEDAYWRISGPAKRQVEQLTAAARKRIAEAPPVVVKKPTSVRPAGGGATDEVPVSAPTIKGAVGEAARNILRDLGIGE